MRSDMDVYTAAAALIEHHGMRAGIEAAKQADMQLASGNDQGHAVWLAVLRAISTLQTTARPRGETLH